MTKDKDDGGTSLTADDAVSVSAAPWQSIESAPKDGTKILGFDPEEAVPEVLSWESNNWVNSEYLGSWHPTHWMSLPAPPSATETASDFCGNVLTVWPHNYCKRPKGHAGHHQSLAGDTLWKDEIGSVPVVDAERAGERPGRVKQ